jgi:hypothetical protein
MSACAVKRGFFVLRDCGQPAAVSCSLCARPICPEHLVRKGGPALPGQPGQAVICVECFAKNEQADQGEDASPYRLRHRFYTSGLYGPIYDGDGDLGTYYDDYDFRSFDPPAGGLGGVAANDLGNDDGSDDAEDDDDRAGFADS